jgi:NAD(P)-dependent dehydrogenase (short-subunit alcohol dehydrogenase family)
VDLKDKHVVITGAANGIGWALARRFKQAGARGLTLLDLDGEQMRALAGAIDALGLRCDVAREADVIDAVRAAETRFGAVDLFCSNAGIALADPDRDNAASALDEDFRRCWDIHVMAHVYAARAVLPSMIARRSGYLLNTVSAAGLLSQIGSATYSSTKHAAIGFAEHLAITHREHGIKVSVLCPQAVRTRMIGDEPEKGSAAVDGIISPEELADSVIAGLAAERFLILPHPVVLDYMRRKTADYDRWIGGMAKLRHRLLDR